MQQEQLRYTRTVQPVERRLLLDNAEDMPDSPSKAFTNSIVTSISEVYFRNQVKGFMATNGSLPVRPSYKAGQLPAEHADMGQVFRSELSAAIGDFMHDIDPRSPEGKRVKEMAPALTEAILGGKLIEGVQSTHLVETAKWAVAASINPDIIGRTTIRTGMGGSDDTEVSMRLPAYALPALDVWSRINDVRQSRLITVDEKKQIYLAKQVVQPQYAEALDEAMATNDKARKKEIFGQINTKAASLAESYEFNEETLRELERSAGVFDMPAVEFFTASNAAIVVNEMDADHVMENTRKSQAMIAAFAEKFYPEAAEHVKFRVDAPLKMQKENGTLTREGLVISYLENLLERYDGEDVLAVMETLRKRGVNHAQGDEVRAELYAALHPVLFADRLEVPVTGKVRPREASVANITIGGRPERLFNEIRTLLSDNAGVDDFVEYAAARFESGDITDKEFHQIERWASIMKATRNKYEKDDITAWARPDLPALTIPLITKVGQTPVYYKTRADVPVTAESVREIRKAGGFDPYFAAKQQADNEAHGVPSSDEKARIGYAITDTAILLNRPRKGGTTLMPEHINDESILEFMESQTITNER